MDQNVVKGPWPDTPTNVRLVFRDGTEQPVEVRYHGSDADGMRLWVATEDLTHLFRKGIRVKVGKLPPRTSILFTPPRGTTP